MGGTVHLRGAQTLPPSPFPSLCFRQQPLCKTGNQLELQQPASMQPYIHTSPLPKHFATLQLSSLKGFEFSKPHEACRKALSALPATRRCHPQLPPTGAPQRHRLTPHGAAERSGHEPAQHTHHHSSSLSRDELGFKPKPGPSPGEGRNQHHVVHGTGWQRGVLCWESRTVLPGDGRHGQKEVQLGDHRALGPRWVPSWTSRGLQGAVGQREMLTSWALWFGNWAGRGKSEAPVSRWRGRCSSSSTQKPLTSPCPHLPPRALRSPCAAGNNQSCPVPLCWQHLSSARAPELLHGHGVKESSWGCNAVPGCSLEGCMVLQGAIVSSHVPAGG